MKKLFLMALVALSFPVLVNGTTHTVTQATLSGDTWFPCNGEWPPTLTAGGFIDAVYQATLTNSEPDTIVFDFTVATTIVIPNNARTTWDCATLQDMVIIGPVDGSGNPLVTLQKANNAVIELEGDATNITIENLNFVQNANSPAIILRSDNHTIRNCNFSNSTSDAIQITDGAAGTTIENCTIENPGNNGVHYLAAGSGNTLSNSCISGAPQDGILVENTSDLTIEWSFIYGNRKFGISGTNANSISVENCKVGITKTNSKSPNGLDQDTTTINTPNIDYAGINLESSTLITLIDNVISGNAGHGIKYYNSTNSVPGAQIYRNKVGTDTTGMVAIGNFGQGMLIESCSRVNIGGIGQGNQVCANGNRTTNSFLTARVTGHGIELRQSNTCTVAGNLVGTDATGNSTTGSDGEAMGNQLNGIYINGSTANNIGGLNDGEENIVCGNGFVFEDITFQPDGFPGVRHGIQLHDAEATVSGNVVLGNYIGLGADGSTILGNRQDGISLLGYNGSASNSNNTIGGTTADHANIIVGNEWGIFIQGPQVGTNNIIGNFIGTLDAAGSSTAPNNAGGIAIIAGSQNVNIGSSTAGNYIYDHTGFSIWLQGDETINNEIVGNIEVCNSGIGITLQDEANDSMYVTFNIAETRANMISGFTPNIGDRVDIYVQDTCGVKPTCQESGSQTGLHAGYIWVGSVTALENTEFDDGSPGIWEFDLTDASAITAGLTYNNTVVTATNAGGSTSQFHTCENVTNCTPPSTVTLNVADDEICDGESTELVASFTGGDLNETYEYIWYETSVGGNVLQAQGTDNTYDATMGGTVVVYVIQNGVSDTLDCGLSDASVITLTPTPDDLTISGDDVVCFGEDGVTYTATTAGAVPDNYVWTVPSGAAITAGDGTDQITVDFGTATAGAAQITVTGQNNGTCLGTTDEFDITIQALPSLLSINGPDEVCSDSTGIVYTANPNNTTSTYNWGITSGGTISNDGAPQDGEVSVSFNDPGTPVILYFFEEDNEGCESEDSARIEIIVNTRPTSPTAIGPDSLCSDETQTYSATGAGLDFAWTVTGGTPTTGTGTDLDITAGAAGTMNVSILATDATTGCPASAASSLDVTVLELPSGAVINGEDTLCVGEENVAYTIASPNSSSTYTWTVPAGAVITLGQGTSQIEVSFAAAAIGAGQVTVVETNEFGCDAAAASTLDVEVFGVPAAITIDGDQSPICQSAGNVYSVVGGTAGSTYDWTIPTNAVITNGDGTDEITVTFSNLNGNITVIETSAAGCAGADAALAISLDSCELNANFGIDPTTGCEGDLVTFTDISTGTNIVSWDWDFGVDATPPTASSTTAGNSHDVSYSSSGTKTIRLEIENNLGETADTTFTIDVRPLPVTPIISGPVEICDESTNVEYLITNAEVGAAYTWGVQTDGSVSTVSADADTAWINFGNTDASADITVDVDLDGCPGSASLAVTMNDLPITGDITGDTIVCAGDTSVVYSTTFNVGSTYEWTVPSDASITSGAGTSSIIVDFGSASGQVTVIETNANGCEDNTGASAINVSVQALPSNTAISGPEDVCVGDQDVVYTASGNANSTFNWLNLPPNEGEEFNGNSVTLDFGNSPDNGAIVVQEISEFGCEGEALAQLNVTINSLPDPKIIDGSEFGCEGQTFEYSVEETTGSTYDWTLSDNSASIVSNPDSNVVSVTFGANDITISVTETNAAGCVRSDNQPLDVAITPLVRNANLTIPSGNICDDNSEITYNFVLTAENMETPILFWSPEEAVSSQSSPGTGIYNVTFDPAYANDNVTVFYSASNLCNTLDTQSVSFPLSESIVQNLTVTTDPICEEELATFVVTLDQPDPLGNFTWEHNSAVIVDENGDTLRATGVDGVFFEDGDTITVTSNPGICIWAELSDLDQEVIMDVRDLPVAIAYAEYDEQYDLENLEIMGDLILDYPEVNLIGDDELEDPGSSEGDEITYVWNYWNNEETRDSLMTDMIKDEDEINGSIQTERNVTTVYLTVSNGVCEVTDSVVINVDLDYWIPSAFSPNGDDSYDVWTIRNIDRWQGAHITVYNRWGNLVYDNIEDNGGSLDPWDGTRDGQDLPMGTYFYIVKFTDSLVEEGDVSILR